MRKTLLALGVFALILAFCSYGFAAEVTVTTAVELQTALTSADQNGEDDTITLEAGTYLVSDNGGAFTYSSNSSDEGSLTITGTGEVILDGEGSYRVLDIYSSYMTDITLQNLIIQSGDIVGDGAGACIDIDAGNINVVQCSFKDNYVGENYGGGFMPI